MCSSKSIFSPVNLLCLCRVCVRVRMCVKKKRFPTHVWIWGKRILFSEQEANQHSHFGPLPPAAPPGSEGPYVAMAASDPADLCGLVEPDETAVLLGRES